MDFEQFEIEFLALLEENNKKCIDVIEKNEKLIMENLINSQDMVLIQNFIFKLEEVVLSLKKFKLIEKALKHTLFKVILTHFKKSDILIRACQNNNNIDLIKWLLTMDIDLYLQDIYGMTALMYAVQHYSLIFVIKHILKKCSNDILNITDNNGNNALFHGIYNINILNMLLDTKIDYHHINNDNENILLYCCKMDKYNSVKPLLKLDIDTNMTNNVGKTAAMYLVENNRYLQLREIVKTKHIDVNYKNKYDETLVTVYLKKYYTDSCTNEYNFIIKSNYYMFKNKASTFLELIQLGCDFNVVMDEEGNTPILFLLLIEDYVSANYLLNKCQIDVSVRNIHEVNALMLSTTLNGKIFDGLEYNKNYYRNELSLESLRHFINIRSSDDYNFNRVNIPQQNKYKPPVNIIDIQKWYLEILYPKISPIIIDPHECVPKYKF